MTRGIYHYLDMNLRKFELISQEMVVQRVVFLLKLARTEQLPIPVFIFDAYLTFFLNYSYDKKCKQVHLFVYKQNQAASTTAAP